MIFGIGMPRTATTSLHAALQILGYHSLHWGGPDCAEKVWREMVTIGHSPTLEQYDAASDLPVSVLYKELDAAYPTSKFILTLRDESGWLHSAERFWRHGRDLWDLDSNPFVNCIHEIVYGQKDFDAEIFLERYRRHNTEVRHYFKDRPGDLLVMPQPGWRELCEFLGLGIPAVPYPAANRWIT